MNECIKWGFPLPRTHTGLPLGNATTGLLLWGEGNCLKVTIGRADLWDNRGGGRITEKHKYQSIRECLETNNETQLREMFRINDHSLLGKPARPSIIPVGRIDLILPEQSQLVSGVLDLKTAEAVILYKRGSSNFQLVFNLDMLNQRFCIEGDELEEVQVNSVPSWRYIGDYLKSISFAEPSIWAEQGWGQSFPENDGISVAYSKENDSLLVVTQRSSNDEEMFLLSQDNLDEFRRSGVEQIKQENKTWWRKYWADIPNVSLPNEDLSLCYHFGLYKFACLTNPSGVPATLQGPWIEEYDLPSWSSDYHFNINVQMCYWPAYRANKTTHLLPIFHLVWSWRDQLRKNAKNFAGIDDGYMLPHAVDDRCTCMGAFWTGIIDHACTAWIAQMMYRYVRYNSDLNFLKDIAYPFMKGAMRVFEVLIEQDGECYCLPISVSPEYRGAEMNAWGENASFQLAAIHRLCEDLICAAEQLGEKPSDNWLKIRDKLPDYTTVEQHGKQRIALWDKTDLEESHRHHSHLGGICPFDSFDLYAPEHRDVIENTINHWVQMGTGRWAGWSLPWASMLYSRLHNGEMAEYCIEMLTKFYMNQGFATLHDSTVPGFSTLGAPATLRNGPGINKKPRKEIMQLDAAMGAVVAIQDMMLHERRGIVYIFPGITLSWINTSFIDMPCEGGFFISAELKDNVIQPIKIKCKSEVSELKLRNPWLGYDIKVYSVDGETIIKGDVLSLSVTSKEIHIAPLNLYEN